MRSTSPIRDRNRVLVMIGVRSREPVVDLMRSQVFFEWFDAAGVEDIPAVFAGEIIERFDFTDPRHPPAAPGVMISAIASMADVNWLGDQIRSAAERFTAAGVRKVWAFRAFDDSHEVMILQELEDEGQDVYETIEDIWPDYPTQEDFLFNEDEY